jgi:hypothetical protein
MRELWEIKRDLEDVEFASRLAKSKNARKLIEVARHQLKTELSACPEYQRKRLAEAGASDEGATMAKKMKKSKKAAPAAKKQPIKRSKKEK